ncbi:MAG TPA: esterase-like activity of phytase family protein [Allosphingosinicella sp.]|nr:esterase-like activity of phytase family protein [Allosphingosinicella sp.]
MRIPVALAALFFLVMLGSHAWPVATPPPPPPAVSFVEAEPVQLRRGEPERRRVGKLLYLGGWALTSNDPRFGGISGMHVEGESVTAVSDSGWLIRFPLPRRAQVRAGIEMLGGSGSDKADRDIEALVVHGESAWVSLERRNAVIRFDRARWRPVAAAKPKAMERWRGNRGGEAMVRLADGRFIIFSEGSGGISDAVMFAGDPAVLGTKATKMRYRPPEGYRITDAAVTPDGRLLFLNRRLSLLQGGFLTKLTLGPVPETRISGLIEGEEIAALRRPLVSDNMEALSVTQEGGRTILWMASDNNYNSVQRTLLLKFLLEG